MEKVPSHTHYEDMYRMNVCLFASARQVLFQFQRMLCHIIVFLFVIKAQSPYVSMHR